MTIQHRLRHHINFRIDYSISAKSIGILIGIALKLQIASGSIYILTILTLPIYEHMISFHLIVSSVLFINDIQFLMSRFLTPLIKFSLKYFVFDTL